MNLKSNINMKQQNKHQYELYELASGQNINTDKSFITFSHNTTPKVRSEVFEILEPMQDSRQGKYLGLLAVIGKPKNQVLQK